ncbi:class I SAM-dependent methyltransferase [Limosilactobacillus allomucosae]|uniref:class I SAM-dependent methyltransferase n=1 Tax=Limosilactobacillus allomucosae TaxID=3142938 RepID=UPI003265B4BB
MKFKRVDAPLILVVIVLAAILSIVLAVVWHQWLFWLVTVLLLICLGLYLNASWRGKEQIIDEAIKYLHLSSDAQVLDLGTDQGNVLVKLAKRLAIPGHATGVEIGIKSDQSNKSLAHAKASLQNAAMADRASVQAADILNLPFKDHQFDGILIWMTLHKVKPTINRARAVQEAARTLKSDGTLAIIDFKHFDEYQKILAGLGFHDITVHQCGVNGWWGGPWLSTKILLAKRF